MRRLGEPPPEGALIVREGKRRPAEQVVDAVELDSIEEEDQGTWDGLHRISVMGAVRGPSESLDDFVLRVFGATRVVKNYRIETEGALAAAGFEIGASDPEPYHYDVILGEILDVETVTAFDDCFDVERRNERWKEQQRRR